MSLLPQRAHFRAEFDRLHATARHERQAYQQERDELLSERKKLIQAHYAGTIPLDLLGEEQERIARRLAFLEAQVEAGDIEYEKAQTHIDDCLALAGDCHAIYMSIDDSLRRIANQAFFDKLIVLPDDGIVGEPGEPFNSFFNPEVQTRAIHYKEQTAESGPQTADVRRFEQRPSGGDEGTRTLNLDLAKVLRCQLRHVPGCFPDAERRGTG